MEHHTTQTDVASQLALGRRDAQSQPEVVIVEAPLLLIAITTALHYGMYIELALIGMKGAPRV